MSDTHPLYPHYQAAIKAGLKLRARELAAHLNTTEGDLVACRQGIDAWQLNAPFHLILQKLNSVGDVMTITRNDHAVHETKGTYHPFSFAESRKTGLVVSEDIDLRLFIGTWQTGFYLVENARHSLQFFNQEGTAVHKVYQTDQTDQEAWQQLVEEFKQSLPSIPTFTPVEQRIEPNRLPTDFNKTQFVTDWEKIKDVHEYHGMLKKHQLTRTQALEQIGDKWATKIQPESVENLIRYAQETQCDIMIFVGNSGCIQIYSGKVQTLLNQGPWFNILDPNFNLHLKLEGIAQAWILQRPSSDGVITSVEAFDKNGHSIMTLFGKRKPGQAELPLWQTLVERLKTNHPLTINHPSTEVTHEQ